MNDNIKDPLILTELPRAGRLFPPALENDQYYAFMLYQDGKENGLKCSAKGLPYISKNVYCFWSQPGGETVVVEVKEVTQCYILSRR